MAEGTVSKVSWVLCQTHLLFWLLRLYAEITLFIFVPPAVFLTPLFREFLNKQSLVCTDICSSF